jgi:hypothetical protein
LEVSRIDNVPEHNTTSVHLKGLNSYKTGSSGRGCGSSDRASAQQAQGPEIKPHKTTTEICSSKTME